MSKRGYHHGNLRQALVEAALALIEEKGPQGFTLSEAAKAADVTPAAVYRHFAGRDDLIAEAARQGYEIFAALMEFAYDKGQPTALAAFEATGRAYLAFARKYPGHYQAMFESGLSLSAHPDLAQTAARARAVMEAAANALSKQIAPERRPPATMFSAHIWALSHGIVELFARASPGIQSPYKPEDLLEAGI
ncbi:MAG: TetR/AcrR family transcriptional regulator, partial [Paracoccaceae bacterium]|nr:TetR/AcrR family transcriptional regulator [Paracoccaceae bacterium]